MKKIDSIHLKFTNFILIVLLSVLTVNKFSPEFLNADVIINSVMSLQNVTLFYWGQNRLVNLLPLLSSIFRDPVLNLYFVLFTAAFAHYLLLFNFAKISIVNIRSDNKEFLVTNIFLFISLIFIFVINNKAIFSITIWHFEYSLPLLMIICVFWNAVAERLSFYYWIILSTVLIFVAIGLNYSLIIVCCSLFIAYFLYARKITIYVVAFTLVSIFSFVTWNLVSNQYGNFPYSEFNIEQLPEGISSVVINIIGAFSVINLVILFFLYCVFRVMCTFYRFKIFDSYSRIEIFMLYSIAAFCFGWLILFSSSKWVEMNQYHYRYFIFLIYGVLIFAAFQTSNILKILSHKTNWVMAGASFLLSIITLWGSIIYLPDYELFKKIDKISYGSNRLYAGDYWVVWPSVFRDMMGAKSAFGLTIRGEGNKENAKKFVNHKLLEEGHFTVLCLNDTPVNCKNQIFGVIGPVFVDKVVSRGDGVCELILTDAATSLSFQDESFASLPSNAGLLFDFSRVTNGTSGCLFFGPYFPFRSGSYILKIFGSSENAKTAIADVVSNQGSFVHARFKINPSTDHGVISSGVVNIPTIVKDLEVRVCVSESDKLIVTGYELLPR
jgi:hypothetical protein